MCVAFKRALCGKRLRDSLPSSTPFYSVLAGEQGTGLQANVPAETLLVTEMDVLKEFALRHCNRPGPQLLVCRQAADRSAAIAVQLDTLASQQDMPMTVDTPDWNIFGSGHEEDGLLLGAVLPHSTVSPRIGGLDFAFLSNKWARQSP